jgi:hypothetical protein
MNARPVPGWALSFVDLCLLLLGFFVMLHALTGQQAKLVQGLNAAFGSTSARLINRHELVPATLFEPGEAMLKASARGKLAGIGKEALRVNADIRIESVGVDAGTRRFDGWELAAARTAAIAREIQATGVGQDRITLSIPDMTATKDGHQRLAIELSPGRQAIR